MGRRVEAMAAVCDAAMAWVDAARAYDESDEDDGDVTAYVEADVALIEAVERLRVVTGEGG
ncbi:MAG: hypothetical protein WKF80_10255 [Thermomicrobiales bacterium]